MITRQREIVIRMGNLEIMLLKKVRCSYYLSTEIKLAGNFQMVGVSY